MLELLPKSSLKKKKYLNKRVKLGPRICKKHIILLRVVRYVFVVKKFGSYTKIFKLYSFQLYFTTFYPAFEKKNVSSVPKLSLRLTATFDKSHIFDLETRKFIVEIKPFAGDRSGFSKRYEFSSISNARLRRMSALNLRP